MAEYVVRSIAVTEARPLRLALLHAFGDPGIAAYPGDDHPSALHLGGFREERLVAVGSISPEPPADEPRPDAWRIEGLAVEHGHRGRGLGGLIAARLLEHAAVHRARRVWGIAPAGTYGFCVKYGLIRVGDPLRDEAGRPAYRVAAEFAPPSAGPRSRDG